MEPQEAEKLIRTKLRRPFTRHELVPRPRLRARIGDGLRRPLTLITAPAGFGKTTLVASCITDFGMPIAWLSLDEADNQAGRFLDYLVAALREADNTIAGEAAQLLAAAREAPSEAVLTSLVNDLDTAGRELALVLDDYQLIRSRAVHEVVGFLLEHCPHTLHLVITTRSDPPLPLARLRARGQMVELRTTELRFTETEAARFLNDIMGLGLDAGSIAVLEQRTEGWVAGLQMAALSMLNHEDVSGFIKGFSGTNRYILDYLLEEVLASQSPEIQRFLLYTSILERLTAPLCDAVLGNWATGILVNRATGEIGPGDQSTNLPVYQHTSQSILEYLEETNLFLVPLDEERLWYRYHHLFADLLRSQLQRSLGAEGIAGLHIRASEWHAQHGSILSAIDHASLASDDERVERLIEQHYMEMVRRGEMSGMRLWTGKSSTELVYRRPWLCIYEAYSRAWFGELDEAALFLEEAQKRVEREDSTPDADAMMAHLAYIKSRVTAMRGDIHRAIEFCQQAREHVPDGNLALEFDSRVTLGYEYFLSGDYDNASRILKEAIRFGITAGAIIHTVAASCMLARLYANQGLLQRSYDTYHKAAQRIPEASEQYLDARALIEIGLADVSCEWNDLDAALAHLNQGLSLLPWWGKADDLILAYVTLARIHLALANTEDAAEAVRSASQVIQTHGVFSEARNALEMGQVKLWLTRGNLQAIDRWTRSQTERFSSADRCPFEDELACITQARAHIALNQPREALASLSSLEEMARSAGRMGRVIEILLLRALALQDMGNAQDALLALAECLALAEPEGYARIFLDAGQPMGELLGQWLAHASAGRLQAYAIHLLSQFDSEPHPPATAVEKDSPTLHFSVRVGSVLVEPLTQREREVLDLIALGKTNKQIARQLIVAPGTIKAHSSSIYRKLDVANRTEAVARARELGILR
ncbi:MAG: LuxR C-terminal-related transcriptional regulator [Anaerolineae bacterium]|jgi:LuxR family maltose regulon positive regulatory protein